MKATHYRDPETGQTVVELRMDDQELSLSRSSKEIMDRVMQTVAGEIAGLICLKIWPGIEAVLSGDSETERLSRALHAASAHPDYSYITTPSGGDVNMNDWEPNTDKSPEHGDLFWRRRKEPA